MEAHDTTKEIAEEDSKADSRRTDGDDSVRDENTALELHTYLKNWTPDERNHALSFVYSLVEEKQRVLDVGCGIGLLGKYLTKQKSCSVVGIDYDPKSIELAKPFISDAFVVDLRNTDLKEAVKGETFDAVLFADVIEHFAEPKKLLEGALQCLSADGSVIISVPNIAHSSVRLALFEGRFDYTDEGLLDRTHLHFFTLKSLLQLLESVGLVATEILRVYRHAHHTEIPVQETPMMTRSLIETAEQEPEGLTYQFVVRAERIESNRVRNLINLRYSALEREVARLTDENRYLKVGYLEPELRETFYQQVEALHQELSSCREEIAASREIERVLREEIKHVPVEELQAKNALLEREIARVESKTLYGILKKLYRKLTR
ncbi:MAG: class I SAM-dependent methyltransferase [Bdellovibrionales bacterium]|nr:class I SAM-dependent methyltransferase [Bdellovibrionales bacterium]